MLSKALQIASANAGGESLYVDDVFSTYLYTGNGSTQTITNGIDLAGEGGLTWIKSRSATTNHFLFDTIRGALNEINSNTTEAQASLANSLTAFNANGFNLGAAAGINENATTYCSWTFRKAEKFFDVVTYTGNGVAGRTVAHNLGAVPACIIVKQTAGASAGFRSWYVYHRSLGATKTIFLNLTNAAQTDSPWGNTEPTSTQFTVNGDNNVNGGTYVAYLFAHDAGGFGDEGDENVISCGSFTSNASDIATINLGWEPQFVMMKPTSTTGHWWMADNMRGFTVDGENYLRANSDGVEAAGTNMRLTNTGFIQNGTTGAATTFIYIAIRRPMKTPESGTEVFEPFVNGATTTPGYATSFPPDFCLAGAKDTTDKWFAVDRLRGAFRLNTASTSAESSQASVAFYQNGAFNQDWQYGYNSWVFRRASGFFDVVCYTGTGVARTVAHNLTVVPELMIVKGRSSTNNWIVYSSPTGNTRSLILNSTNTPVTTINWWNNTSPTASVFTVGAAAATNDTGILFVAYLFATLAGVSKVGGYTGNGSSQTINCDFVGGARFVMIKRTDSTGDWYVWDSARGIVAGNDPHLSLNTTATEVTTDDSVDVDSSGFIVNQVAATNVNVNAASYIFLAIA